MSDNKTVRSRRCGGRNGLPDQTGQRHAKEQHMRIVLGEIVATSASRGAWKQRGQPEEGIGVL